MYAVQNIQKGKRNATIEFCQVRHVDHKHERHELTMPRTLSKALFFLKLSMFVYQVCWLIYINRLTAVTNFINFPSSE